MSGKRGIPMRESDAFQNRPVSMNPKNNLLEIEEHMYILDDVEKPNVFRNMFPYSEIPKIPFNDRIVPHNMPKDIWITDTTFRDGQQSRAPYTTEQIVKIYDYLHELGGPNGMIRASEFFLYSKKDRDAVCKRDRNEGDWHSGQLFRLSYFPEIKNDQKTGHGSLFKRYP